MSIFNRIFSDKRKINHETPQKQEPALVIPNAPTSEYARLLEFTRRLNALLLEDKYLARSDYRHIIDDYADVYTFFSNMKTAKTTGYYCQANGIDEASIETFLRDYADLSDLREGSNSIMQHNRTFLQRHLVSEKHYLDTVLSKVDPAISLDEEQRKVVLTDEDYTLVVAGAGAGKTTTVSAKVKYLVERKGVAPEQILVISFTNKAVGELRDKINKALKIDTLVTTFHKTGYAILRKQDADKKNVVDSGYMFDVINNYLKNDVLREPEMVNKLILFFGSYFDAPYEGDDLNAFFNYISKADSSTMRSNMNEYVETITNKRTGKAITINYESLRSSQEVQIANFLYLNKIDYEYEKIYPYSFRKSHKPYTPDFTIKQGDRTIYIEHFGITEDGTHNRYTETELKRYNKEMNDKVKFHCDHGTELIYTISQYKDGRPMLEHLKEQLINAGVTLQPRAEQEVYQKIVSTEENKYILKLVRLLCTFIQNFKTNGYDTDKFCEMHRMTDNVRTKLFLDVCHQCYLEYSKKLKERGAVDFEDMINDSAKILREQKELGEKLNFKYIIIDEYQDISQQRFDLARTLSQICDAKIIAVGDDWQSIYAYAGAKITLFTNFADIMGYGEELKITKTYRNSQEVIDIAGSFIQKNSSQIKKSLISPKHIDFPIIIEAYSEDGDKKELEGKGGKFFLQARAVERCISQIMEANAREGKPADSSILLIGRYGFDAFNLSRSGLFTHFEKTGDVKSKAYPKAKLTFLTAHRSKGLGYDNVIIINAVNATYGFPSKVEDDPVMKLVIREDLTIEYAEERRLFYVAMTRTKNRVYIVVPQQHPSRFVAELVQEYDKVCVNGELDISKTDSPDISMIKRCPVCGYPLQYKHKKDLGLRLWICTNEPEICDFMTNDLSGGLLPILKCDCCKDGYLIVRTKEDRAPFLGCTNYKADKSGCNRKINLTYYENMLKRGEIEL
ncbi:MAG: UvrD-helicase domain-containing protein [Bacteroidales bacterium]|nr:UvrD-helicase domain-containing protein [Bacteroidales bacterium]